MKRVSPFPLPRQAGGRRNPRFVGKLMVTLAVSGFVTAGVGWAGLTEGTAHADPFGNHQWCPGQDLPKSDVPITWDMGTCHDYHYQGAWTVVEGVRPNPCPPVAFMCP
jgi:hypothetical protein